MRISRPLAVGIPTLLVSLAAGLAAIALTNPSPAGRAVPALNPATSTTSTSAPGAQTGMIVRSGMGNSTLAALHFPRAWTLEYSYICVRSAAGFDIEVHSDDGAVSTSNAEQGAHGTGHASGSTSADTTYTIAVTSPCAWTVTVSQTP